MNILPIIFSFILIFSFLTLGFIHDHIHSTLTEKSLNSFHKTTRIVLNAVSQKRYKKIKNIAPPTSSPASQQSTSSKTLARYHSQREHFPPLDTSKFNLSPLLELQTDPKIHPLYEICAQFLRVLYENTLFKPLEKEGLEYDLIHAMIQQARSHPTKQALLDLYPEATELRQIFYKMLKGTNHYDVETRSGIPPMEDFFILDKAPAIYFSLASSSLLKALFDEKTGIQILAEEKKKYETTGKSTSLTQEELTQLLASDPVRASRLLELGQLIDFSQKSTKNNFLSAKDTTCGLTIKKKIAPSPSKQ